MPVHDLDLILNKEAIITTYPATYLRSSPEEVERNYLTYARTHIPLGDTTRYVETIFKWVGGPNKGAFIGAVAGDFGHGKTSFQVHVWEQSTRHKVLAVPPFHWNSVADMVDGVAAWVSYCLTKTDAKLARKAARIYETYKQKSLQDVAKEIATRMGQDVDDVLATLKAAEEAGNPVALNVTPERFLEYCTEVTEVAKEAGYAGILVLLDEPEVAARHLSIDALVFILFELANGLAQRQGDYGVFISIPEKFLASIQSRHAALTARLQARNCFPRLKDLYGPDFAEVLWSRYVAEFELGQVSGEIVSPEALEAIGQVGSSARTDLSYGPRTVVSAFRQMVYRHRETAKTYQPVDFVNDCLEGNILVLLDYPTLVQQLLGLPEYRDDADVIKLLAAFPNGMPAKLASAYGAEKRLAELRRRGNVVYKSEDTYGLVALRQGAVVGAVDQLRETVAEIVDEYAPSPRAFEAAVEAFITHVIPLVFERRQKQQLLGWEHEGKWLSRPDKTKIIELHGAFRQTEKDYPARAVAVAVGPQKVATKAILPANEPGEFPTDILYHFAMRWSPEEPAPERWIEVSAGDPKARRSASVRLVLDFSAEVLSWDLREELKELLDSTRSPLAFLYLVNKMDRVELAREHDAVWRTIRDQTLRDLLLSFVDTAAARQQAKEQVGQTISGALPDFLGSISRLILMSRYPHYRTLIRTPQWQEKVGDYIRALKNQDIPLACKRGRELWRAEGDSAAKAFGTSQMNLVGGAFAGFESLISIKSAGRNEPTEVDFRIHPLEQAVKEAVTSHPKAARASIQGKECPYLTVHDLVPLFMGSGYQLEELQCIVEIGDSRGTFRKAELRGRPIVYSPPIDPVEMRAQLREKLNELTAETEEFGNLPDYQSSIDLAALGREIDEVRDEAEYDAVNTRIAGAFEHNRARIPGYVDRLADAVRRSRNEARELREALQKISQMATAKASAKATSSWSAALSTHVAQGIRKTAASKQTECDKIVQKADAALNGVSNVAKAKSAREGVALLIAGFGTARDLREDCDRVKGDARLLQTCLDEHQEWLSLLSLSDSIYDDIVELKNDPSHAAKGAELLGELQKLWDEISDHLSTRGLLGLESHKQYRQKLQQLAEKRRTYVQRVKDQFDKDKERINQFLAQLGILGRCTEVFNPADADGSYTRLYEQAAERTRETYRVELDDLQAQRRELLYANKILNRIEDKVATPALASLDKAETNLSALLEIVAADWIKEAATKPERETRRLRAVVDDARAASKSAKTAVRDVRPPDRKPSANADAMLRQVAEGKPVDLKDLVLHMMGQGGEPEKVLELSLECLGELFKIGRIQVKVEKVNRR